MFLVVIFLKGWSQNPNLDYNFAIKLSNLTSFEKFQMVNSRDDLPNATEDYFDFSNIRILNPTISLQFKTRLNNFHEIEIINCSIEKEEFKESYYNELYESLNPRRGHILSKTNISMKYEYIYLFYKSSEKKIVPSIGLSINPLFYQVVNTPVTSLDWETDNKLYIVRFQLTPRLSYFLSSKLFVDLSIPLTILDFKYHHYYIDNNTLIEELKTSKTNKTSLFPVYYCGRIGIGYKF